MIRLRFVVLFYSNIKTNFGTDLSSPPAGKMSWPELLGVTAEEAERKIKEEKPELKIHIIPPNSMVTMDYRLDRVRLFVDESGKVAQEPRLG